MNAKTTKIIFWTTTGLVASVYLGASIFYTVSRQVVVNIYTNLLKSPGYLVWPIVVLKIVAAVVLLWRPSTFLSDWVYASTFWQLLLAASAHVAAGHLGWPPAVVAWGLLIISFLLLQNRLRTKKSPYAGSVADATE